MAVDPGEITKFGAEDMPTEDVLGNKVKRYFEDGSSYKQRISVELTRDSGGTKSVTKDEGEWTNDG